MAFKKAAAKGGKPEITKLGVAVFPPGELHYSHLSAPDTEGEYADGKYKVTCAFDAADEVGVRFTPVSGEQRRDVPWAELEASLADQMGWGDNYEPRLKEYEEDHKRFAGKVSINPKSQYPVAVVDSDNEAIDLEKVKIGNGTLARVSVNVQAVKTKMGKFISVQLRAVKVDELKQGGSYANDFEDDDEPSPRARANKPFVGKPGAKPAVDLDDDIPF